MIVIVNVLTCNMKALQYDIILNPQISRSLIPSCPICVENVTLVCPLMVQICVPYVKKTGLKILKFEIGEHTHRWHGYILITVIFLLRRELCEEMKVIWVGSREYEKSEKKKPLSLV